LLIFVSIHQQIWPPEAIHFSDWLISKKIIYEEKICSKTAWPNESKLGREHPLKILYKDYSFRSDSIANMAATDNSCF
jgi:hypothetical protein